MLTRKQYENFKAMVSRKRGVAMVLGRRAKTVEDLDRIVELEHQSEAREASRRNQPAPKPPAFVGAQSVQQDMMDLADKAVKNATRSHKKVEKPEAAEADPDDVGTGAQSAQLDAARQFDEEAERQNAIEQALTTDEPKKAAPAKPPAKPVTKVVSKTAAKGSVNAAVKAAPSEKPIKEVSTVREIVAGDGGGGTDK